jgi:hypothetical protein
VAALLMISSIEMVEREMRKKEERRNEGKIH